MRHVYVSIEETAQLVKWFRDFTEIDPNDLEKDHPLFLYNQEYEAWWMNVSHKNPNDLDSISNRIIDFLAFIKGVHIFQRQIKDRIKQAFTRDLKNKQSCYGVFFEIRILTHLHILGCENINYRDNKINGKNPDIMYTNKKLKRIFIECTRKHARPERYSSDRLLI